VLEPILTISFGTILTSLLAVMAVRLTIGLHRFSVKRQGEIIADLPSVTVCIPARNETHALTECLERVLASDYKKVEIIVFDDNSSDDTSILVRSFAHAGVRFVPGVALPDGWLGKNHALSILAREASGAKLLYLDVDTKINSNTISRLVDYCATESIDMVSILPLRRHGWRLSVLFTPLRYFWEILLASRRTPATTSAIWMIDRSVLLNECGGFEAIASDVRPEQRLAERVGTQRYHFLIGSPYLGIYQEKRWSSQVETSRRLLYPLVGMSPVMAIGALILLLLMSVPLVVMIIGLLTNALAMSFLFGALWMGYVVLYGVYTTKVWHGMGWVGALLWPVVILQEAYLLVASVVGYMTHTITWKGRLVTAPVLQDDYLEIDK
jgi:chlorobactene glucosyltransferase